MTKRKLPEAQWIDDARGALVEFWQTDGDERTARREMRRGFWLYQCPPTAPVRWDRVSDAPQRSDDELIHRELGADPRVIRGTPRSAWADEIAIGRIEHARHLRVNRARLNRLDRVGRERLRRDLRAAGFRSRYVRKALREYDRTARARRSADWSAPAIRWGYDDRRAVRYDDRPAPLTEQRFALYVSGPAQLSRIYWASRTTLGPALRALRACGAAVSVGSEVRPTAAGQRAWARRAGSDGADAAVAGSATY